MYPIGIRVLGRWARLGNLFVTRFCVWWASKVISWCKPLDLRESSQVGGTPQLALSRWLRHPIHYTFVMKSVCLQGSQSSDHGEFSDSDDDFCTKMKFGRLPALPVVTLRKSLLRQISCHDTGCYNEGSHSFSYRTVPCLQWIPAGIRVRTLNPAPKVFVKKGKARPDTEMSEVPMHTANSLPLCLDQRVLERTFLERNQRGAARCLLFDFRHEVKAGSTGMD